MPSEPLRRAVAAWVPRWWVGEGGWGGLLLDIGLLPASAVYRSAVALRNLGYEHGILRTQGVPIPVVSVGNLGVGGAGKTPFAAWIARWYLEAGQRPAVALRGYGKDEILLHQELNPSVPVFAAPRRVDAARAALAAACNVVVLDDGFQHRALARDLDLALISADTWQTRRRLLPRGPWREPDSALRRADFLVLTRKSVSAERVRQVRSELEALAPEVPVVECSIVPEGIERLRAPGDLRPLSSLRSVPVLAVAALAEPAPFLANLESSGIPAELAAFPDHHPFDEDDAHRLAELAKGRPLVMTQKDAVKLRPVLAQDLRAYVLRQRVEVARGADLLRGALRAVLKRAHECV